jgi:hypothetical protein
MSITNQKKLAIVSDCRTILPISENHPTNHVITSKAINNRIGLAKSGFLTKISARLLSLSELNS